MIRHVSQKLRAATVNRRGFLKLAGAASLLSVAGGLDGILVARQAQAQVDAIQPGQWFEIPNSRLDAVLPDPLPQVGYGDPSAIMAAWSGGAYDSLRDRLIVWGGGHGNYSGNEVYAFQLATRAWVRLTDPSPTTLFLVEPSQDVNPDGTPVARETYGGLQYLPNVDRFWASGGSRWWDGDDVWDIWTFDLGPRRWQPGPRPVDSGLGVVSDYDPVTGHVFFHGYTDLVEYDPVTTLQTILTMPGTEPSFDDTNAGVIDPRRRRFIVIGTGVVAGAGRGLSWYDLTQKPPLLSPDLQPLLGDTGFVSLTAPGVGFTVPGVAYSPTVDRVVVWGGGTDIWTVNLDTWLCLKHPPAPGSAVPTPIEPNGTYGRWRYVPSLDLFIGVNRTNENVYLYRLPTDV